MATVVSVKLDCSKEHGSHHADAKFCWLCGEKLEEKPDVQICNCGRTCDALDRFCPACGEILKEPVATIGANA